MKRWTKRDKSLGEGNKVRESARKTKFGSILRDCGATDDYLNASAQSFYQQTQKRTNPHTRYHKRGEKNGKEKVVKEEKEKGRKKAITKNDRLLLGGVDQFVLVRGGFGFLRSIIN